MKKSLSDLNQKMVKCIQCPLSDSRTKVVTGRGSVPCDVLFVGEAPGRDEDEQGLPFVGASGKQLDKLLIEAGFGDVSYYITNVVKCRPIDAEGKNRVPSMYEINVCSGAWLIQQIKLLKPKIIVPLGRAPTAFFLQRYQGIPMEVDLVRMGDQHGKPFEIEGIQIIPTYHPASTLYHQANAAILLDDLKKVKEFV